MADLNYSPMRIHQYGFTYLSNWWNYSEEEVTSAFWRAWINTSEGGILHYNNHSIMMKPHVIYLVAPETSFSTKQIAPFSQLHIHFSMKFPNHEPQDGIFDIPAWPEVLRLLNEWQNNFNHSDIRTFLSIAGLLHTAVSKLPEKCFEKSESMDRRIRNTLKSLSGTTLGHYTNAQLAKMAKMSESAFIHLFTEEVGVSPQRYYRNKRIERAMFLLACSNSSIESIAADTGFVDRYHFSRIFREITGTSPKRYRNMHKTAE